MSGFMDYRPAGFIKGTATASPNIYDADGNLILQLIHDIAGSSSIKGQVATGGILNLFGNSTDAYPYFRLVGDGAIQLLHAVGSHTQIYDGAVQALKVTYASNKTIIVGGVVTGDDLDIFANDINNTFIQMQGNANTTYRNSTSHNFYVGANSIFQIASTGIKFGTYVATPATDSVGYITIKDIGGTDRKVMIQA